MNIAENRERRLSIRRASSESVTVYCRQLELDRCKPANISARGAFIDFIPKRAYVGRRVQLVFVVDRGRMAKMIRVYAVIAHISNGGVGFGFIGKHIPTRARGLPGKSIS